MRVTRPTSNIQLEYASRVFKLAKATAETQGQNTLRLIESAPTDSRATEPSPVGTKGRLINTVA